MVSIRTIRYFREGFDVVTILTIGISGTGFLEPSGSERVNNPKYRIKRTENLLSLGRIKHWDLLADPVGLPLEKSVRKSSHAEKNTPTKI